MREAGVDGVLSVESSTFFSDRCFVSSHFAPSIDAGGPRGCPGPTCRVKVSVSGSRSEDLTTIVPSQNENLFTSQCHTKNLHE